MRLYLCGQLLLIVVISVSGLVVVKNGRQDDAVETTTVLPEVADLSVDPSADYRKHYNFDLLPDLKTCGMSWQMRHKKNSTRSKRVVGGKLVKLGKYPWLGRLELYEGKLTQVFVLTLGVLKLQAFCEFISCF